MTFDRHSCARSHALHTFAFFWLALRFFPINPWLNKKIKKSIDTILALLLQMILATPLQGPKLLSTSTIKIHEKEVHLAIRTRPP